MLIVEEKRNDKVERPDPAGVVRRGEAAERVCGYVERSGELPTCSFGAYGGESTRFALSSRLLDIR